MLCDKSLTLFCFFFYYSSGLQKKAVTFCFSLSFCHLELIPFQPSQAVCYQDVPLSDPSPSGHAVPKHGVLQTLLLDPSLPRHQLQPWRVAPLSASPCFVEKWIYCEQPDPASPARCLLPNYLYLQKDRRTMWLPSEQLGGTLIGRQGRL